MDTLLKLTKREVRNARSSIQAVVLSGGLYPGGLPLGLEIWALPWKDGNLFSWA